MKYKCILFFSITWLVSCNKGNIIQERIFSNKIDASKVYKVPSSSSEKELVLNIEKVSEILQELYKSKTNIQIVNAAIISKAYTDNSILLKDLIYPYESRLKNNQRFIAITSRLSIQLTQFADSFWKEVSKKNDTDFNLFLSALKNKNGKKNQKLLDYPESGDPVSIYFPYIEEFVDSNGDIINYEPIASILVANADADEGWGLRPYFINGVFISYVQVLVNDEYAENNPTHIIGVNGIEPYDDSPIINSAFPPGDPIDLPNLQREVKQVYVGDVRCRIQYDALISFTGNGGGSEIRFTRADGYLKIADGQVQADMFIVGDATISRYNIRHQNWVDYASEWDGDWEAANLQQNMAIFEEDNRNNSTFSASITTTLSIPATNNSPGINIAAPIGFTINYKSDDSIIKQTNFNRDVFFILNRFNLEGELRNGWPVRDKNANVSYTLNDRTFF